MAFNDRILDVSSTMILAEGITNSKVVIIKDMGHLPIMERPKATIDHLAAFIDSI